MQKTKIVEMVGKQTKGKRTLMQQVGYQPREKEF